VDTRPRNGREGCVCLFVVSTAVLIQTPGNTKDGSVKSGPPLERAVPENPASNGGAVSSISICRAAVQRATGCQFNSFSSNS
jgi:hypothetical protein